MECCTVLATKGPGGGKWAALLVVRKIIKRNKNT